VYSKLLSTLTSKSEQSEMPMRFSSSNGAQADRSEHCTICLLRKNSALT
jgi:hypothetical protein